MTLRPWRRIRDLETEVAVLRRILADERRQDLRDALALVRSLHEQLRGQRGEMDELDRALFALLDGRRKLDGAPAEPVDELPDWEREFLVREWINNHGNPQIQWLIRHLDERFAREKDLADETVWELADQRGEEIGRLWGGGG